MTKRIVTILLLCVLLILTIAGCKDFASTDNNIKEENKTSKVIEGVNKEETNSVEEKGQVLDIFTISDARETEKETTDSAKESESSNVSAKQNATTSNATSNSNPKPQSANNDTHIHNWVEQTQTITHPEEGHYKMEVVKEAYDEKVYAWRTLCNKCGEDITDLGAEGITYHSAIQCESGYHNDYIVIDTIHHDAVTKQVWIVDIIGCTETVVTGYKCDCGESIEALTSTASREAFDLINQERVKLGLQPAVWDSTCEKIARIRAREVFALSTITENNGHEGFYKFQNANHRLCECVAWGYKTAGAAVIGWMNSSAHRDVLMDDKRVYLAVYHMGGRWVAVNSR